MTRTILVAGTASHVGKSTVAAGLCRLLSDRGYRVAPFKAQNMSNNARVAPIPAAADPPGDAGDETALGPTGTGTAEANGTDGAEPKDESDAEPKDGSDAEPNGGSGATGRPTDREPRVTDDDRPLEEPARDTDDRAARAWGEIGVSQYVQARAARRPATTDHNPVLLKPRGDAESQLIVHGRPVGHYAAGTFYEDHWETAREAAAAAHARLTQRADVIVAEGAGGLGEINLHDRDLANVATARFADARIVLCADTERGGAFAALYGTYELLPDDLRDRVVGAVFTKFRGDPDLLDPGIAEIEDRIGVPVLGVLPYDDPGLPAEDSLSLPATDERRLVGDDDVPSEQSVTVGAIRLPHVSNATDLEPLARVPGVRVAWLPVPDRSGRGDESAKETAERSSTHDSFDVDALVVPGTKNTVDDLRALRATGVADRIRTFDGPIVGLCGGYQLLGERLTGGEVESTDGVSDLRGLGLLPVETRFARRKRIERVTRDLDGVGPLAGAGGSVAGYEIHMGRTTATRETATPVGPHSVATDRVLGTYLHGLFENRPAREAFVDRVFASAGLDRPADPENRRSPYDAAADLVRELDLDPLLAGLGPDGGEA